MTSSSRARIVYLCDFNAHGGTQTHLLHLMAGLDRGRFEPSLVTLNLDRALAERLRREGVAVTNLGLKGALRPSTFFAVGSLTLRLRRQPPSLLHGFLYQGNLLTAALSTFSGVPCVTSVRNLDRKKQSRQRRLSSWAHRRALRVIFNSERVRDETLASETIRPERAVVIYNGVADPFGTAVESSPHSEPSGAHPPGAHPFGIHNDAPTLLAVASLREKKGHADLLEAFRRVREVHPGARLMLAGEGPLRATLEERARALGVAPAVQFLGYRPDVVALLRLADLFLLASLEEGMPNALLEAMAAGIPAVVTAVGGNPEAVVEGETGWLVPANDPAAMAGRILLALEDPARRRAAGASARRRFEERFSLPRMLADYEALYGELLG